MTSPRLLAIALLASLVGISGCSSGSSNAQSSTKIIHITFSGGSVTPKAETVSVAVGQPVELDVSATSAGELHVHSSPPQTFAYHAGQTKITFAIDRPGVVDVESHALNTLIVQLRVQ